MRVGAILLMAGSSTRFADDLPKQLYPINGKPVFQYSLDAFRRCVSIDDICIVVSPELFTYTLNYINSLGVPGINVVKGGKTRQESVKLALYSFTDYKNNDLILIHDAARPLIDSKLLHTVIDEAKIHKAVTTYINETDTIAHKKGDMLLNFIDRNNVIKIQTPQAFQFKLIQKAHFESKLTAQTDDCSLVKAVGGTIKLVEGSVKLHKITTKNDIEVIERLLKL